MNAAAPWEESSGLIEVNVEGGEDVGTVLERAVEAVQGAAVRHQTGILIAHIGPGRYIVRAHPAVPFGLIRQNQG